MEKSINSVIEQRIADIKAGKSNYSVGRVSLVREYIVEATGLENVAYFERVLIGDYAEGYVDAVRQDCVVIAITKMEHGIKVGERVVATGKEFTAQFVTSSVGHIVDIFGEDKLAGKKLEGLKSIPVEADPISIMERTAVKRPLLTGITGIDLLYPIGRGQRQLIIGDQKTGKTQICLDTIYNQRGENVICIYVAIGKTKKDVKNVYLDLLRRGAMEYTIILTASNDECAPVLRLTPYVAMSIAKLYLNQSKDVLVVLDDLKRHADVCREIALLMNKTPGRDAYPPDIFYSHSRMLELGCQHQNGGSITVLPICETKGGDITDYISTNIISITDGQIVLSQKNFEKGQKPAINYGLSVSRLGGAVQTSDMKSVGTATRRELLSYLEQREVYELANVDEMNEALKNRMQRGAKILGALKQSKFDGRTPQQMMDSINAIDDGGNK